MSYNLCAEKYFFGFWYPRPFVPVVFQNIFLMFEKGEGESLSAGRVTGPEGGRTCTSFGSPHPRVYTLFCWEVFRAQARGVRVQSSPR